MLKYFAVVLAVAGIATGASAAERQPCVTVSYDHQGTNDDSKLNTSRYIATQTTADVRCDAVQGEVAQAPTFGWQPSSKDLADKHPTVRR
jgi:hypothetical protein